jgi:hypothetical protein
MKVFYNSENLKNGGNTRPHPGPLPRGEGEANHVSRNLEWPGCSHRLFAIQFERSIISADHFANNRRRIPPLLGERAGVRVDVNTKFKEVFS